jgi:hypothetical protein
VGDKSELQIGMRQVSASAAQQRFNHEDTECRWGDRMVIHSIY